MNIKVFTILLFLFSSWSSLLAQSKPTLIFYCGTTMVKPIKEMARIIEKKHNCIIKISQGGSKDLYNALKFSQRGDLYLPGSDSYRINNLKDGLLKQSVYIGYNQASIFVQKGNPKKITTLTDLTKEEHAIILCNPDSGSVGKMTKKIFIKVKGESFFTQAYDNAVEIGTDSRNLNKALINNHADATINWKATALWKENIDNIDAIALSSDIAPRKNLQINLLSFSKHPKIAKDFMNLAISPRGQKIMRKYGFLD